jgi:hypothetical protein
LEGILEHAFHVCDNHVEDSRVLNLYTSWHPYMHATLSATMIFPLAER